MNEVITLTLVIVMFCFTDLILDQVATYGIGYIFIGLLIGSICVHLFFMIKGIIYNARL